MSQAYNLKSIASSSWKQMKNELQLDDSKQKTEELWREITTSMVLTTSWSYYRDT